ncbi:DEAD/DEAH box helicase [Cohnella lubricantis]|uniref:SNF2 helicase associated domain-containing protein n=1 Tax=Cohnella lubricantis TaxID=2163172 RepID=A0A841THA1_9BACL|nr:DEAD/DEAH box helicase [Cohnella lubricantis]MBB6678628.1 SNF2 helicase associated domain-containing protein [Cohnella lubricantis]MBP2119212.1 SNF2 family DNA or RNA helicase [Cohnella lubricantis]
MSRSLSLQQIKLLCGQVSYDRGLKYVEAGRVMQADFNEAERRYDAYVWGSARYSVRIVMDLSGVEDARCSCDARHSQYYCKHIAAVLIHIFNAQQPLEPKPNPAATAPAARPPEPVFSSRDIQFAKNIISLFDNAPSAAYGGEEGGHGSRVPLDVEFICKAVSDFSRSPLLALEMRVGPKRLYIVQRIKEFLGAVEQQLPFVFAKLFTYDPAVHIFKPDDEAIIRRLIDITHSESAYRDAFRTAGGGYSLQQDRHLIIPPYAWEELLPLLQSANVRFEQGMREQQGIWIEDNAPPLEFELNPAEAGGLQLDIHGLERIQVLDNYGYVAADCVLYRTDEASMRRIDELKRMFAYKPAKQLLIPPAQVEPFMDRVIPGLRRIGEVTIAASVSDRFISPPLEAKLDLDWLNGRLLARLVYNYGDIRINPLRPDSGRDLAAGDRILLRDVEKEGKIMSLIERANFKYNGSELYLDDEDELYRFQFRLLPQLEKLTRVTATEVMKTALLQPLAQPKLTIDVDAHTQWLEVSFDMEGIDEEEIRDILRTLVEKKSYYRLSSGSFLSLEDESFQEIARLMDEMDVAGNEIKGSKFGLSAVRGLSLMNAAPHGQSVRFSRSLRQLLENMRNPDNLDFPVPDTLSGVLREYQKFGYQWMKTLAHYHFGGILADDMGLGKTLQSIAFIESAQEEIRSSGLPVLIVSPASLLYNWKSEIAKFAPDLRVTVAAGLKQERSSLLEDLGDVDVLVTSYPLLRRDMELYAKQQFYALFLDEAQAIKNHATQTAHAVKLLRAGYRFALTGTPIENSLDELWSLFDAVFPELFGSRRAFAELSREGIAKRVRPFILRRMKTDVLKELPDKIETLQLSELTDEQKKLYVAYLSRLQAETVQSLKTEGFQKSRMRILAGLTRLRQLCCHPALFVENYEGDSGKLEQLLEIVDEALGGGKRMLIFSQFTSMLGLIREELALRGQSCFYLDGQTPAQERVELCRRYNEGEQDIFLISLRAGGTGLNLTGADTVILYDLWWNPAVEQQAADRAHRIGQKKVVQVIRLVTQGTIEEKMVELQKRKQDLIAEVIKPGEESLSAMTEEDIRELLMI